MLFSSLSKKTDTIIRRKTWLVFRYRKSRAMPARLSHIISPILPKVSVQISHAFSLYKRAAHQNPGGIKVLVFHHLHQTADCGSPDIPVIYLDGGERRVRDSAKRQVIKSHHRDILGHGIPTLLQGANRTQGQHVVGGKKGGGQQLIAVQIESISWYAPSMLGVSWKVHSGWYSSPFLRMELK